MRKALIGLALLAGLESAALACSCMPPGTPEQSRASAREAVRDLVAIVDAEALSEYRWNGPAETVRVRRILFGEAPRTFRIERGLLASSASCDLLLTRGQRKILILTKTRKRSGGAPTYRIQSLCSDYLTAERYLPMVIEEARRATAGIDASK